MSGVFSLLVTHQHKLAFSQNISIYSTLDIFNVIFRNATHEYKLKLSHSVISWCALLKPITRVVIATRPGLAWHTCFQGFYSYIYSSGAYLARL